MAVGIQLTKGLIAIVDDEDAAWVNERQWSARVGQRGCVAAVWNGVAMHRAITGAPKGVLVDHKNRNSLDNRRANLRECTEQQNSCNRAAQPNNLSGFKGVSINKRTGAFRAAIAAGGLRTHIGTFQTAEEAARAYDAVALRIHGEFAWLNFPEGGPEPVEPSIILPRALSPQSAARLRQYRGVRAPRLGKETRFNAVISVAGRGVSIGWADTAEEAARLYDRAALAKFGAAAQLNFPELVT